MLVRPARLNCHAAGAQNDGTAVAGLIQGFAQAFETGFLQKQVHGIGAQVLAVTRLAVQLAQHGFSGTSNGFLANQLKMIAAIAHFYAEALLDKVEIFVELAAEGGETSRIDGFDTETMNM